MRSLNMYKNLTAAKKMFCMFACLGLSTPALAQEVSTGGASNLSDHQYNTQQCLSAQSSLRDAESDFGTACSKAGLGSATTCKNRLEDCQDEPEDHSYCLNNAISNEDQEKRLENNRQRLQDAEDKQRDLDDRRQDLVADLENLRTEEARLLEEADIAQEELNTALSEIENGKADALQKMHAGLEAISAKVAEQYDQLDRLQLKLREFILKGEMECRKKADASRSAFIARERNLTASGRKHRLSQEQLIRLAGMSVNARGTNRYNEVLRRCTSPFVNGKRTAWGSNLAHQKALIEKESEILQRSIRRLNKQRTAVKDELRRNIGILDQQKLQALAAYQNKLLQLNRQMTLAQEKKRRLNEEISRNQLQSMVHVGELAMAQNNLAKSYSASEGSGTTQSRIDAFNEALALKDQVDSLQGDLEHVQSSLCPELSQVSAALDADSGSTPEVDSFAVDSEDVNAVVISDDSTPGAREPATGAPADNGVVISSPRPVARPTTAPATGAPAAP